MPWAWYWANWYYDPVSSYLSGLPQFSKPYPQTGYEADVLWNDFPLRAMSYTIEADRVFRKDPETWGQVEDAFYDEMIAGLNESGTEL